MRGKSLTINGETHLITEWSKMIDYSSIYINSVLRTYGEKYTIDFIKRKLFEKQKYGVNKPLKNNTIIEVNGTEMNAYQWAKKLNLIDGKRVYTIFHSYGLEKAKQYIELCLWIRNNSLIKPDQQLNLNFESLDFFQECKNFNAINWCQLYELWNDCGGNEIKLIKEPITESVINNTGLKKFFIKNTYESKWYKQLLLSAKKEEERFALLLLMSAFSSRVGGYINPLLSENIIRVSNKFIKENIFNATMREIFKYKEPFNLFCNYSYFPANKSKRTDNYRLSYNINLQMLSNAHFFIWKELSDKTFNDFTMEKTRKYKEDIICHTSCHVWDYRRVITHEDYLKLLKEQLLFIENCKTLAQYKEEQEQK